MTALVDLEKYAGATCTRCRRPLVPTKTEITYLGSAFTVDLPACPSCGMVLVPEELATGKMFDVEKILEDK